MHSLSLSIPLSPPPTPLSPLSFVDLRIKEYSKKQMRQLTRMTKRRTNQEIDSNRESQEPYLSLNCPPWTLRLSTACLKAGFFCSKKILLDLFVHTSNSSLEFSSLVLAIMETCQQNKMHKANRKYTN